MRRETHSKSNYATRRMEPVAIKERPGWAKSSRIRVVCISCNNGWMSQIEEEAKPILTPMIKGEVTILNREEQESLARWISLKVLICEHAGGTPISSPEVRQKFMHDRSPLRGMNIWLSRCDAAWSQSAFSRQTASIRIDPVGTTDSYPVQNVQTVTIGIGNAFFYIDNNLADAGFNIEFRNRGTFSRVWPVVDERLFWPPLRALAGDGAIAISKTLLKILDDPRVKIIPFCESGRAKLPAVPSATPTPNRAEVPE